jgi:hypothetical protein
MNLNQRVKVKLTQTGRDIFYHQYDELNKQENRIVIAPSFPDTDKDGYYGTQLWCLFELFGPHISMGKPIPIEDIIFEGKI